MRYWLFVVPNRSNECRDGFLRIIFFMLMTSSKCYNLGADSRAIKKKHFECCIIPFSVFALGMWRWKPSSKIHLKTWSNNYSNILCHLQVRTGADRSGSIGSVFCLLSRACPQMALLNRSHSRLNSNTLLSKPIFWHILREKMKEKRGSGGLHWDDKVRDDLVYVRTQRCGSQQPLTVWSEPVRNQGVRDLAHTADSTHA